MYANIVYVLSVHGVCAYTCTIYIACVVAMNLIYIYIFHNYTVLYLYTCPCHASDYIYINYYNDACGSIVCRQNQNSLQESHDLK